MLSKAEKNRLLILYFILKRDVTWQYLSKILKMPRRTIKEHLKKLNEIFENEFHFPSVIQSDKNGKIHFNGQYHSQGISLFFKLKLFYLKHSVDFLILKKLVVKGKTPLYQLSKEIYVSPSYLSRRIHTLNKQLRPLDISIKTTDGIVFLMGNELLVRIFGYMMLSDAYQSLEFPFYHVKKDEFQRRLPANIKQKLVNFSNSSKSSLDYLFHTIMTRMKNEYTLTFNPQKDFQKLSSLISTHFDISMPLFSSNLSTIFKDKNHPFDTERHYFNFLTHIFSSELLPKEVILNLGAAFIHHKNHYAVLANKLLTRIQRKSSIIIDTTEKCLFIYHLTIYFAYYEILDNKTSLLETFLFQAPNLDLMVKNNLAKQLDKELTSFILDEGIHYLKDPHAYAIIHNLITTFFEIKLCPMVQIYVAIKKDLGAKFIIEHLFSSSFNKEQVKITDNFNQADLIITDSLEVADQCEIQTYFFDSLRNHNQWLELVTEIQMILQSKMLEGSEN